MNEIDTTAEKIALHFVEADLKMRAELMQVGTSLGYHCEIYSDFSELAAYPPRGGIIFVSDRPEDGGVAFALDQLISLGISLPVVAMDCEPTPSRVVSAIKGGALDYLVLPLRAERLAGCLARIAHEAEAVIDKRRRTIDAQRQLSHLSPREREVLDALSLGLSNKEIARVLDISPRTVEIHRANMMTKIGARHSAGAIRVKLEAGLGSVLEPSMLMPAYA
jgi:FixJ family two-component response regulator